MTWYAAQPRVPFGILPDGVKLTPVFETYFKFAAKRQDIFFKRLRGEPGPWTDDPILKEHKFTNCYRACDRASQYLIKNVIYDGDEHSRSIQETFFRILLFKIFNKPETWELFTQELGETPNWKNYKFKTYDKILCAALARKEAINSGAYMMSASGGWGRPRHQLYLELLERWMNDDVPQILHGTPYMSEGFKTLRPYKLMGNFLAYQYVTDIGYSPMVSWSEIEFTIPGPGAVRGIQKCFTMEKKWKPEDVIRWMQVNQDALFEYFGLTFQKIGTRSLQLIDIQNLFCEVDKYSRRAHPEITTNQKRSRIKSKFRENPKPIEYCFPPFWDVTL